MLRQKNNANGENLKNAFFYLFFTSALLRWFGVAVGENCFKESGRFRMKNRRSQKCRFLLIFFFFLGREGGGTPYLFPPPACRTAAALSASSAASTSLSSSSSAPGIPSSSCGPRNIP